MMKRYLVLLGMMFIIGTAFDIYGGVASGSENANNEIIRFHVRANSDNEEDQALKLKVRDAVIDFMYPILGDSKSIEESRVIMESNMDMIQAIAQATIYENGYDYSVSVELREEYFPVRTYEGVVFPQGLYEALIIEIGASQGQNWWCVMFPPLCFIDVVTDDSLDGEQIELKLKSVEMLNEVFGE